MKNSFKDEDKKQVTAFLNHVAKHAVFTHKVNESIEFYKLLSYMQTDLIPKISDNVFEVTKVVENKGSDF
jgi:hypothetical protein